MDRPLISIITPCYNGERYLADYFRGILDQAYDNIELIFINDGSSDSTEKIALKYGEKMKKRGMKFLYISQANSGQAAAINRGLSAFSGDYFTWLDSDDIMLPNNLADKVTYLTEHPECGFVINAIEFVDESDVSVRIGEARRVKPVGKDTLFEDLILQKNIVWVPGTILVRRECILQAIPTKSIYVSREGQNVQLMLPIAYLFKCGYIDEALLKCVIHRDSHSRIQRTLDQEILRERNLIELYCETINRIPEMSGDEKLFWFKETRVYHNKKILKYSMLEWNLKVYIHTIKSLREDGHIIKNSDRILYFTILRLFKKCSSLSERFLGVAL